MPKKSIDINFLTQGSEEIELPSKGILYTNKSLKTGKIHIRTWLTTEEKLIDKFNRGNFYNVLKKLVSNVVEENFPIEDMLMGDFFYTLYWVRNLSYGATYKTEVKCPKCGKDVKVTIDMGEYNVVYMKDCTEPMSMVLPRSGIEVKFRLTRLKDIIEATERNLSDKMNLGIRVSPDIFKLARCINEMTLPNTEKDILTQEEDFNTMINVIWPKIPAIDVVALREEMSKYDHGYVENKMVKCPECENYFEQAPVLSFEFFRPGL